MSESIWTRERKLMDERLDLSIQLSKHLGYMTTFIYSGEGWDSVARTADLIRELAQRLSLVDRELEMVVELVDGYARIEKRMDELEKAAA